MSSWIKLSCVLFCFVLSSCTIDHQISYPNAKRVHYKDTFFEVSINDPYQWLENNQSQDVQKWVLDQNKLTQQYLKKGYNRRKIKKTLSALHQYEKRTAPIKRGQYFYFYIHTGSQNHAVLYQQKEGQEAKVFLDPNRFSKDGSAALTRVEFSQDGRLVAYLVSESGSDWQTLYIMRVKDKLLLDDPIKDVKFSDLSWYKNEGVFYSKYHQPQGSKLTAKVNQHVLVYHRMGTHPKNDQIVFGDKIMRRYVSGRVSENQNYLMVTASQSTSGNEVYVKDLREAKKDFIQLVKGFKHDYDFIDAKDQQLYFLTNHKADNNKVVSIQKKHFKQSRWQVIIPESKAALSMSKGNGFLFARYLVDVKHDVYQYDYRGKRIRKINLPLKGSVSGFSGKKTKKRLYFNQSDYHVASHIFSFDVHSGKIESFWKPTLDFQYENYVSKQVFYPSKDGSMIPMRIVHRKDLKLEGKTATMLYGYGGFNISILPRFNPFAAAWLKLGGVYAVANIRGGGEYGKAWHLAGTKQNKQNVFDDFIAAAEYLIQKKYTHSEKLAIHGRSNGGLLVAAVMNQRPELFRVVLPEVGVLDMLRYHKFTAGAGWSYDYGRSDESPEMFRYLKAYSPYHNISSDQEYPAVLITTSDHDDRVVPAHSYKVAAKLQAKRSQNKHPLLIRIETAAGHGAGLPLSKRLEKDVDLLSFTWRGLHQ